MASMVITLTIGVFFISRLDQHEARGLESVAMPVPPLLLIAIFATDELLSEVVSYLIHLAEIS